MTDDLDFTLEDIRRGVINKRSKIAARSPLGIAYSTFVEQIQNYYDPNSTPEQRSHLRRLMGYTLGRIAALEAAGKDVAQELAAIDAEEAAAQSGKSQ